MASSRTQSRLNVFVILSLLLTALLATPASAARPAADNGPTRPGDVALLSANAQGVTLALAAPTFDLVIPSAAQAAETDAACQQAQAAGFVQSEETGRPQLPTKVVLLGVPPNAELKLEVNAGPARILARGVNLCTAQPVPAADEMASAVAQGAVADPAVYGVDAPYPAETVRMVDLGFMRSQRIVRLEIYPLQFNPVSHELRASDRIELAVRFAGRQEAGLSAAGPVAEPAEYEAAFQRSLLNYEAARAWRKQPASAAMTAPTAAWTPPQPGYKIFVREEGIYQLTQAALATAGLPVGQLDPRTLRLFSAGQEVAIRVVGEEDGKFDAGDVVLFFGQGADTRYTDTNVYWLTYGGAAGLRMAARPSQGNGSTATSFFTTVKKEINTTYDSSLPMSTGYDHWYGQQLTAVGVNGTGAANVTAATPELASGALNASVSVMLGAITAGSHHVRIYVNPTSNPTRVWDGSWDGIDSVHLASATFPQSYLSGTANNTIKIELVNDQTGRTADIVRVDWVRVGYQRKYAAANDALTFGGDASTATRYAVTGFSTQDVELYDVTDPAHVASITGATMATAITKTYLPLIRGRATGSAALGAADAPPVAAPMTPAATYVLRFGDNQTTPRRYLAQSPARRLAPLGISLDQASNLQATNLGADLIMITHADFKAAIQPLADLRAAQGLRVQVVDVQDVYDEFNGGLMSAEAIHDFISYAYNHWVKPAPASVLLVGDGTYDFRGYKYTAPTYLPPYLEMVDPDAGETATDNRFVTVTAGDVLPDLNIGRLPANTAAEATAMVNKILAYEAQSSADWMRQVVFVADDLEGGGGDFYQYSNAIADGSATYGGSDVKILPAGYTPDKIYLGQTCDLTNPTMSVECRAQIVNKINTGSLMVSYIGHGTKTYWAVEHLYDGTALAGINNATRLPIMLPMTCNEGYFIDPAETSLSEIGVRADNKGAIASWSATGYGLAPGHDFLERGLFLALFYDKVNLGAAATQGKLYLAANAPAGKYLDLIDTFLLLGDPTLRVPVQ